MARMHQRIDLIVDLELTDDIDPAVLKMASMLRAYATALANDETGGKADGEFVEAGVGRLQWHAYPREDVP